MTTRTMMAAAFALAAATAVPATAQQTSTSTNGAPTGTMSGETMDPAMQAPTAPKMTRSQTAAWKKCQAMPEAKMMKSKSCMKMSKMMNMNNDAM